MQVYEFRHLLKTQRFSFILKDILILKSFALLPSICLYEDTSYKFMKAYRTTYRVSEFRKFADKVPPAEICHP